MRLGLLVIVLALALVCSHAQSCQAPGTCTPPNTKFSRVMPAAPRLQWWTSGGYCGALSVQSIALGFGVWVSQDLVRKAAPPGGGHGDPADGYEILHTNIEAALANLRLVNTAFPWQTAPQPQSDAYLLWLKQQLRAGSPVVWFIMCSGDEHNSYNIAEYDHVEPVWGIFSNSSLDVDTVFPDDVLVHGSDWDQNGYYRPFSTLVDSPKNGNVLTGNCSIAVPWGGGPNEAYPCVMNDIDYGYAISGFVDPAQRAIPTSLSVSGGGTEPQGSSVDLTATLLVAGPLTVGATYTIYRFDGTANFPTDSQFERGNSSASFPFVAQAATFEMVDPVAIPSASAVYYVTIATKQ